MKDLITAFGKEELRIMIRSLQEEGATYSFISNKSGVSIHKLRRLMSNGCCELTAKEFGSIATFYGKNLNNSDK